MALTIGLTWTPAESGITNIASYTIMRSVDAGTQVVLQQCAVLRDFLGGIIGVEHCTLAEYPEYPGDPEVDVPPDQNISYVDTTVELGHDYCYQIIAVPMGNNQSVAQGPPVGSNVACSVTTLPAPNLSAGYDAADVGAVLQWGLPAGFFIDVTGWSVFRSVNGGPPALLIALGANVLSYLDQTVSSGDTYTYTVSYGAFAATSPLSSPSSVIVP